MSYYEKEIRDLQLKAILDYFNNLDRIIHYDMDELNDDANSVIGEVYRNIASRL